MFHTFVEGPPPGSTASHERSGLARVLSLVAVFSLLIAAPGALANAPSTGATGDPESEFERANRLYEEGRFTDAAQAYEAILSKGLRASAVYFNLGNAYAQSSQRGRAIGAYRLAQKLTPRDPDLLRNLRHVRSQVDSGESPQSRPPKQAPADTRWNDWFARVTLDNWTLLVMASSWIWFGLLAAGQARPSLSGGLRRFRWIAALAGLAFACALGWAYHEAVVTHHGVVIVSKAELRYGPLAESQAFATLQDGTEVRVLDRKQDWLQIEDGSGRLGWLKEADIWSSD